MKKSRKQGASSQVISITPYVTTEDIAETAVELRDLLERHKLKYKLTRRGADTLHFLADMHERTFEFKFVARLEDKPHAAEPIEEQSPRSPGGVLSFEEILKFCQRKAKS